MEGTKENNKMREVLIDKVTVNIGVGEGGEELDKARQILKMLTKTNNVKLFVK